MPSHFIIFGIFFILIVFDVVDFKNSIVRFLLVIDYLLYLIGFVVGDIVVLNLTINIFSLLSLLILFVLLLIFSRARIQCFIIVSVASVIICYILNLFSRDVTIFFDSTLPTFVVVFLSLVFVKNLWAFMASVISCDFCVGLLFLFLEINNLSSFYFSLDYIFYDIVTVVIVYSYYLILLKLSKMLLGENYYVAQNGSIGFNMSCDVYRFNSKSKFCICYRSC